MTTIRDSIVDAERWLAGVPVDGSSALCVIGLGHGYLLDALDRRGWSGRVVALEPDASWSREGLDRPEVRAWRTNGRLTVLTGPAYDGLDRALLSIELTADQPVIVVHPAVARAERDQAVQAARLIGRAWFGARANQAAKRENGGRYLLNTLRNTGTIAAEGDAAALAGVGVGVPAIVVGAGPSLDRNLPDIAAYRDRALIIAADTSLRPLLAAGIHPDLVVALDPTETNARHLTDLPPCPGTFLVAEGSLDPEALAHFAGRTFFFNVSDHHPWPWLRSLGIGRGRLRAWGSVLTTAFDLSLVMGCDPILFAGADLAFTDGRPYARGTTFEEVWYRAQAWGQPLEECWSAALAAWPQTFETDVHGAPARTAPHLRAFRDWLATEANRSEDRTIINGTGAGILVAPSIKQRPLGTTLSALPARPSLRNELASAHGGHTRLNIPATTLAASNDDRHAWATFGAVSVEAIDDALRPRQRVSAAPPVALAQALPTTSETHQQPLLYPGLAAADAAYLVTIARTESIRLLPLTSPSQDLLTDLRRASAVLKPGEAIVVIDDVGLSVGAQMRRAIDALLCEQPDHWLEYRRFVTPSSQLAVIRGGAWTRTPPAADVDLAKWDPAHQAVANDIAPLLVTHLAPTSVIDVGCGAGFWLNTLESLGVSRLAGITPRRNGQGATRHLKRGSLDSPPDNGERFDVCLCLEVAQYVSPEAQDALIAGCTQLADVVVFSSRVPGTPGAGAHDRPMWYWAEKFWRHGYVGDDGLRIAIEHRWGNPRSVFEAPIVFRRQFTPGQTADPALRSVVMGAAVRAYDTWIQSVWWATLAGDRLASPHTPMPRCPLATWVVPPARLAAAGSMRVFSFRSDSARWYLSHAAATLQVLENGRPLQAVDNLESLASAPAGGWSLVRDEVTIKAGDGSDPRTNGRQYALVLPAHLAWAESQPFVDGGGYSVNGWPAAHH